MISHISVIRFVFRPGVSLIKQFICGQLSSRCFTGNTSLRFLSSKLSTTSHSSNMTHTALVVGATRGLGAELAKKYAANGSHAFATGRSEKDPGLGKGVTFVPGVDVSKEDAGAKLAKAIGDTKLDVVIITAGYFTTESFDEPKWDEQVKMYTIGAIGPVFIVHHLVKAGLLEKGSKIILVSSEGGSITLRTESEGGGMYGHHASKTALNMVGKVLSFDLKPKDIAVGLVQ